LYPALKRAGLKREPRSYGFHLFRHTAGSIVHELTSDLKLSQELLAHSHISTTADIYVHGRREAEAGKATELLARHFVPALSEESVVEEQEHCFGDASVKNKKGRKAFSDLLPTQFFVTGCGAGFEPATFGL